MEDVRDLSHLPADSLRLVLLDRILAECLHCIASSSAYLLRELLGLGAVKLMLDLHLVKLAAKWGEWLQHADGLQLELDHSGSPGVVDAASLLALLLPGSNNGIRMLVIKWVSALGHLRMRVPCIGHLHRVCVSGSPGL